MLTLIIIAISLSMDAFSLSLAYGTLNLRKKVIIIQSLTVGVFHFIMPQIGNYLGLKILSVLPINPNVLVFIVLFIIGLQMVLESFKEPELKKTSIFGILFFALVVSIDSFSLGIGLNTIYSSILISSSIFMIFSFLFTYLGLMLGKKINETIGKISTMIGGIILLIIGLFYII